MTIKLKPDLGPFAGRSGADGQTGDWAAILEANRRALDHWAAVRDTMVKGMFADRWATVSNTMVKGMFAISQEMALFAQAHLRRKPRTARHSSTATAQVRRSVVNTALPRRQLQSTSRRPAD